MTKEWEIIKNKIKSRNNYGLVDVIELQRQHDEVSRTIRRTMLSILVFSLFCVLSIIVPDVELIAPTSSIKIPFVNTEVSYTKFIITAPIILIGMTFYLHVFIVEMKKITCEFINDEFTPLPFIFNFNWPIARFTSLMLLYFITPCVLIFCSWQAGPRPEGIILAAMAVITSSALVYIKISHSSHVLLNNAPKIIISFSIVISLIFMVIDKYDISRSLQLQNMTLNNYEFNGFNLLRADMSFSTLKNAEFHGANLKRASLLKSDLQGASFDESQLEFANLSGTNLINARLVGLFLSDTLFLGANMEGSDLSQSDLSGINLSDVNMEGARLIGVNLVGANLTGSYMKNTKLTDSIMELSFLMKANLENAYLDNVLLIGADLEGANLKGAYMVGSDLTDADIVGASFEKADLSNVSFSGVYMEEAILTGAIFYKTNLVGTYLEGSKYHMSDIRIIWDRPRLTTH